MYLCQKITHTPTSIFTVNFQIYLHYIVIQSLRKELHNFRPICLYMFGQIPFLYLSFSSLYSTLYLSCSLLLNILVCPNIFLLFLPIPLCTDIILIFYSLSPSLSCNISICVCFSLPLCHSHPSLYINQCLDNLCIPPPSFFVLKYIYLCLILSLCLSYPSHYINPYLDNLCIFLSLLLCPEIYLSVSLSISLSLASIVLYQPMP